MILCCGEALIDLVLTDSATTAHPGGGPCNTAVALARLDLPTALLWPLSTDSHGQQLAAHLRAEGVDLSLCPRPDRPTTLARVALDAQGRASFTFHDDGSAGRLLQLSDMPAPPEGTRALVFGGISLALEPCGTAVEAWARAHAPGRMVLLDPNIRPALIGDPAAYRARLDRMAALASIVKLSDEDLAWLGLSEADLVARWTGPGRMLCLTRGPQGATAWAGGVRLDQPAPAVQVVDTVGAGDTFNAGLLAGLMSGQTPAQALACAVEAATLSVTRAGCNPPRRADLAQIQG